MTTHETPTLESVRALVAEAIAETIAAGEAVLPALRLSEAERYDLTHALDVLRRLDDAEPPTAPWYRILADAHADAERRASGSTWAKLRYAVLCAARAWSNLRGAEQSNSGADAAAWRDWCLDSAAYEARETLRVARMLTTRTR